MKWRRFIPHILLFFGGLGYALWSFVRRPFPMLGDSPLLDLMDYHTPNFYGWVMLWYYASPFFAVMLAGLILMSVWKVWLESRRRDFAPFGALPTWPLSTRQTAPAIVIGEVHHPVEAREIFNPSWLTIPERGLYTGVAIFGAVGSGKTSACMHPFAKQLLGWQAGNPQMRAAALMLEVKGDFCHDIRRILIEAGRGKDYIELGMNGRWQWNPLSAWWLDSYSLAYTVSSLAQPAIRQGQGTVLAASLYQSGPLDHRASPDIPGTVGDVAAGLPLRHRPGPFRGQDQASRSVERRVEQRHGFHVRRSCYQAQHHEPWLNGYGKTYALDSEEVRAAYSRSLLEQTGRAQADLPGGLGPRTRRRSERTS